MAWTQPKTWTNEPLVAGDMNTHLRDNLEALKDPPSDRYQMDEVANDTTTSTSFVDIDSTNLSLTIITTGGDVEVSFTGTFSGANNYLYLELDVDGSPYAGDDGILTHYMTSSFVRHVSFPVVITGLSAGSHTIKLQWKTNTGTITLYTGAGTSSFDVHPEFNIREV